MFVGLPDSPYYPHMVVCVRVRAVLNILNK